MRKKKNPSPKAAKKNIDLATLTDWPADWPAVQLRIRLGMESDWKKSLPVIVERFLSLLWRNADAIPPFKIKGVRRKEKLTDRQKSILLEIGTQALAGLLAAIQARSDPQRRELYWAEYEKWKQRYQKALFGKLGRSEKKRAALECLRWWYTAEIYDQESADHPENVTVTVPLRIIYLAPLLSALNRRDAEFFKGLGEAMRMLNDRIHDSKNQNIGSGDTHLEKMLLEYKVEIGANAQHTVRELNEQRVSKFRAISDKKLRDKCRELAIPLKSDARGTRAVRYRASNRTPDARKKG